MAWGYLLLHMPETEGAVAETEYEIDSLLWEMAVFDLDAADVGAGHQFSRDQGRPI